MIVLSTAATVIASQALISGAYSLTQQAVQLGYSPRVTVVHTSRRSVRADLRPRGQLGADGRVRRARRGLRLVRQARRRVRPRRHRHDEHHDARVLRRPHEDVEVAALEGAAALRGSSWRRPHVPRREPPQVLRRRLGPVRHRPRRLHRSSRRGWRVARRLGASPRARVMVPLDAFLDGRRTSSKPHARPRHRGLPDGATAAASRRSSCTTSSTTRSSTRTSCSSRSSSEQTPFVKAAERIDARRARRRLLPRRSRASATWRRRTCRDLLDALDRAAPVSDRSGPHHLLPRPRDAHRGRAAACRRWRKCLFALISRNALSATAYFGIPPNRVVELGMQIEL